MPLIASLPMYRAQSPQVSDLWVHLRALIRQRGMVDCPELLVLPDDLHRHWHDESLLISQTCGYPLMTELFEQVQVIGALAYGVSGCEGVMCRSQLVARTHAAGPTHLADFRGKTVVINSKTSQSGYNSLRALVAPLAVNGSFFGTCLESGSHLQSLVHVGAGLADIAAIDCVTLAGIAKYQPEVLSGLTVIGQTDPYPGLPLITSNQTSAAHLQLLREAIEELVTSPLSQPACAALFITGFQALSFADYQICLDMRDQARALGVTTL